MALPADYTDLANDGVIGSFDQTTLHYRDNNNPAGPLKHKEVDSNFELLRQKVNAAGAGNNALKTIYGDTVSAAASATAANTAKTSAEAAKTAAESAKSSAQQYASNASGSASSASSSANTATARANEIKNLSVTTGAAGSNVSYNSGSGTLTVPRGDKGDKGDKGDAGASPTFSFANGTLTITNA